MIEGLGGPVVVCGHSAAGIPISHLDVTDGVVQHLVYIAANLPEAPETAPVLQGKLMENLDGRLVVDAQGLRPASEEAAIELFFTDVPPDLARHSARQLIPDHMLDWTSVDEGGHIPAPWLHLPATYVVRARDKVLPPAVQRELAMRLPESVEFDTGHSPHLSHSDLVVELLARIVRSASEKDVASVKG